MTDHGREAGAPSERASHPYLRSLAEQDRSDEMESRRLDIIHGLSRKPRPHLTRRWSREGGYKTQTHRFGRLSEGEWDAYHRAYRGQENQP